MVFSEKEVTSLYRVHRTVLEMLRDRNYLVPDSDVNMSIQEFKAKFGEDMRRGDLDMMKTNKDDPSDKINVFFSDSTKLGVKAVTTFRDRMLKDNVHRGILVLQNQVSSQGRRELMNFYTKVRIEIFMEDELLVNITKHELVPKHQVLTDAEKKDLLKTYTCQQTQLPKMLITDPVAKYYGLERGQVVRITRSTIHPSQEALSPWLSKITTATVDLSTYFGDINESSSFQVTFSVVLSTAIAVFFFPTIQRRIKKAKQLKYRSSSGVKKSFSKKSKKKPSPDQALLGAVMAGVIAVILYKCTTNIEDALYRQTISSNNFSVRQITITIRTVINGLCYLATFVYGINSFGLLLYSGQLALNTYVEGSSSGKKIESKIIEKLSNSIDEKPTNSNTNEDQSSNNSQ
ncbi:DNA-directed RNA polymerases II and IV subunit 5A [Trifolium repens]|nr:DNA-directed RNA polymerases II and IV subunit 5A [Trifolium repens]